MQTRYPRCLVVLLLLMLVTLTVPRNAFALDRSDWHIGWGPNVVPGPSGSGGGGHPIDTPDSGSGGDSESADLYGVLVVAPTNYAAAIILCGVSNDDPRLTSEVRMKLSNATYGGEFYELAQKFKSLDEFETIPDFYSGSWFGNMQETGFRSACVSLGKLYGKSNVQSLMYMQADLEDARDKLQELLEGGDSGGDGGGTDDEGWGTQDEDVWKLEIISGQEEPEYVTQNISSGLSNLIDTVPDDHKPLMMRYGKIANPAYFPNMVNTVLKFVYVPDGCEVTYNSTDKDIEITNNNTTNIQLQVYGANTYTNSLENYIYNNTQSLNRYLYTLAPNEKYAFPVAEYYWASYMSGPDSGGGGDDGPIEGDWPEDDGTTDTPTPPTLPEPGDPTIPDPPDPTTPGPDPTPTPKPDPTGPSIPTLPDVEGGETYTADLQGILDALDEHCIHIQTCLNSNFSSLNTYLGQIASVYTSSIVDAIYNVSESEVSAIGIVRDDITQNLRNQVGWLGMDIDGNFTNLLEYLNDLWEWLEETLVFDFSGDTYDDSSLVSWLQKIYDKMGQGISTEPVDVVVDPTGTGSWLDQFLATFFGNLLANLAGVLSDAAGTMATLTTKFPLSLPWDIAAILGLLVAPPVCPAFEFPCYSLTSSGLEQVGTYDVDLHDVEFAVEGIRWMMRLGFVLVLARHTKDFLELIERVID